jgi:exodeoxyribonuclease VII small subunit
MGDEKKSSGQRRKGKREPDFEQAIDQLEQIIDEVESGEVGLEQCLKHYEQGMKLVDRCRTILDQAEQRIAQLKPDDEGDLQISEDE